MVKRPAPDSASGAARTKRPRRQYDQFYALSDEILLRILSNLSVQQLNLCQRVSHRFKRVAGDSQLWKRAYYDRFVQPRLSRLSSRRTSDDEASSSKLTVWHRGDEMTKKSNVMHWKKQYKTRHNWAIGVCGVSEIPMSGRQQSPAIMARLHEGIVYTVDAVSGLRAWTYKNDRALLATYDLACEGRHAVPTSIATACETNLQLQRIAIGFDDGSFSIFIYDRESKMFIKSCQRAASSGSAITALALSNSHLLCMNELQVLSLFRFDEVPGGTAQNLSLLVSLASQTAWPPLSLSIRPRGDSVLASIAYCMPTYTAGWSVGVQELLFSGFGDVLESRLACAAGQGFTSLSRDPRSIFRDQDTHVNAVATRPHSSLKPTSLSYSHPYLLVSHADNTMTLYMVRSTLSSLEISPGKTLWGHTSSIFNAQVGGRGKAVSVSARGDEIRIWELEGGLRRRNSSGEDLRDASIQVTPEKRQPCSTELDSLNTAKSKRDDLGLTLGIEADSIAITRGWVGFDDEAVILLREQRPGLQALTIYDFS